MKVAIFGNTDKKQTLDQVRCALQLLQNNGLQVLLSDELSHTLDEHLTKECAIWNRNIPIDWALSIGGDGTFLTTAARVKTETPILGLNTGRLGFLADIAADETENALKKVIEGKYSIERRTTLQINDQSGQLLGNNPYALNEIAVLKQDLSSMITVHVMLNGEYLHSYQADGLIIATPTGSTAYSLSVGGPILTPEERNLILSPVATHSLNVRPLVIPDDWKIDLAINSRSESFLVSLDGRSQVLNHNVRLSVSTSDRIVSTIRIEGHSFFQTLKSKLMWGADMRQ